MKAIRWSSKSNSNGYRRGRSVKGGCAHCSLVWKVSLAMLAATSLLVQIHRHHELQMHFLNTQEMLQQALSLLTDAVAVPSTTRINIADSEGSAVTGTAGKQPKQMYFRRPEELSPHALSLLGNYNASSQIPPLWNCSTVTSPAAKKLVFVHIYKTAGSSIRDYLAWYGRNCQLNVGLIIGCSNVAASSLLLNNNDTNTSPINAAALWKDAKTKLPCTIKYGYDQETKKEYGGGKMGSDVFRKLDIVGGHLPLGVHLHHNTQQQVLEHHRNQEQQLQQQQHSAVQYLTFVRDPLQKYISGKLYDARHSGKKWITNATLAAKTILQDLTTLYRHGQHYDKYSTYLLTPMQKEQVQLPLNRNGDKEVNVLSSLLLLQKQVDLMQANLVEMNVLVGVVERMDASYRLLQSVMDGSRELNVAFSVLSSNKVLVRNKSKLSSTDILELMKGMDAHYKQKALEVLKYEYQLYNFAVKLHEQQLASLVLQQ